MSSISAGTSTTNALVTTGDTTGALVLKTNNGTTALTLGTDQSATFAGTVTATGGFVGADPNTKLVASGDLANGDKVIVNADGTVSAVTASAATVFESANTTYISSTYDSTNQKVVIAYTDAGNSNYGTAVVGTVSARTITFGTPVVFNAGDTSYSSIVFNSSSGKVVIAFKDSSNSGYATAIVGTVSGTSISFGTKVVYDSVDCYSITATYNSTNNATVITYTDTAPGIGYGFIIAGVVSGTSIVFGTKAEINPGIATRPPSCSYNASQNSTLVVYVDWTQSNRVCAVATTLSGSNVVLGTPNSDATTNGVYAVYSTYDAASGKNIIAYNQSSTGKAKTVTISGTSVTFGTVGQFNASNPSAISLTYDSSAQKSYISYVAAYTVYGQYITVTGTDVSFDTEFPFGPNSAYTSVTYAANNSSPVISYRDLSPFYGKSIVSKNGSTTSLTATNFIGISNAAYSNGQTATIQIVGSVDDAQSGLTAGQLYYVQADGTLATTAGTPSVIAGTAVSATKLIIKG